MNIVFVYGTLKKGFPNSHIMKNSKFLGTGETVDKMQMHSCVNKQFPFVIDSDKKSNIRGEAYLIDDDTEKDLDYLEGVPNLYIRKIKDIKLDTGNTVQALMYIKNEDNYVDAIDTSFSLKSWELID